MSYASEKRITETAISMTEGRMANSPDVALATGLTAVAHGLLTVAEAIREFRK